jgi:hypothetical protein
MGIGSGIHAVFIKRKNFLFNIGRSLVDIATAGGKIGDG